MEIFVALRFLLANRRDRFLSSIPLFSILGIVIGVTVLTTVISVMNGFEDQLRTRVLGTVSHATIEDINGALVDWRAAIAQASRNSHVLAAAPYVEREAMLRGTRNGGALVRGVDPELELRVSDIGVHLTAGKLSDLVAGSSAVLLGKRLAELLRVGVGDQVTAFVAAGLDESALASAHAKPFRVVGILDTGMEEFDARLAIVNIRDAEELYRIDAPSGIRLRLDDAFQAYAIGRDLAHTFGRSYRVSDWTVGYRNVFESIVMQKRVMFLILSLIIAVAAFNLVATLVMQVVDKQSDIAILRTLGTSPSSVMAIFMSQGIVIGVVGITLGTLIGVALASTLGDLALWTERHFDFLFLAPGVYPVDELASTVRASDIAWIVLTAFATCAIATIYPARRAARMLPADTLRFE